MLDDRFWTKVNKNAPSGCWEWTANKNRGGYGMFRPGGLANKMSSHRLSWENSNRRLLPGECVLHHCDNPKCVNPKHLFVGSKKDNTQDMMNKGRHRYKASGVPPPHYKGSLNPRSKMTEIDVRKYREALASGEKTLRGLAREIGVDVKTLSNMRDSKTWKHVK